MFLMFCLEQSDVWPMGDLGVRKGTKEFFGLKGSGKNGVLCGKKDRELMETVVESYRPYRSLVVYYMWKMAGSEGYDEEDGDGGRRVGKKQKISE